MKHSAFTKHGVTARLIPLCTISVLLWGCAGPVKEAAPVFFPPLPDKPRVQFLKGISNSTQVEEKKSTFSLFMTGQEELEKDKVIIKPYGVTTSEGKIYVSDIGPGNLVVIDPKLKTFEYLKGNASAGKLKKPANSAVDSDGNLYVTDAARKEILIFRKTGEFLRSFGRELGMKPADVVVDKENIYVLDLSNDEIKIFRKKDLALASSIGRRTDEQKGLSMPTNLAIDSKGFLYVTNTRAANVMKFDRDGHLLQTIGQRGDLIGEFARPKGVAVDDEGRIFVVDGGHQAVQIFNDEGKLLMLFGGPGNGAASLNLPAGIAITKDNLDYYQTLAAPGFTLNSVIIVANQFGDNKLSFYGLGQMAEDAAPQTADAGVTGAQKETTPPETDQGK